MKIYSKCINVKNCFGCKYSKIIGRKAYNNNTKIIIKCIKKIGFIDVNFYLKYRTVCRRGCFK